ncbi:Spore maturation protein CgeB [Tissierella praeacuta DSM 18095]|uniref:Spore maturation protein CgeB n=1 Tax=Tissierella praeacuta DSM 18095 TaxID=1123404 RepID=A0A1M4SA46_9FIRM|nr:glycosyltransferase [Tissierella praeacuta]TCU71755.1 spore maturation protein CgeB [Tissierella praeacuta]SHE29071.1 Spore maturation protein CgeB [Tissierella praeacuta DSM 18095]SUP01188.1 Uncharacterized protein conserved in bacteria [Tissierella praeacuta]
MENPYKKHLKQYVIKKIEDKNIMKTKNPIKFHIQDSIRVACILDEFSYECFKYEAKFIQLGINNWKQLMIDTVPHFLFVEAAWEGYNKEWGDKIANLHLYKDNTILSIIRYCNENNIPTVFWAKEDPYDFNIFIETAKHFDYIFTTDSNSILRYRQIVNHNNIFVLPFAAQPKLHNPIGKDKVKIGKVAFAGGWYSKFPDRSKNIENVLKPAFKYNLAIYDRFKASNNPKNSFPKEYTPYIIGSLNYKNMVSEYKKYDVFLNVNSTDISPTTFSRRIFELLASGTPTISSYSKGIEQFFKDIVLLSKSQDDTNSFLNLLLNNKDIKDKLSVLGQREVFNHHTYRHRFNTILDKLNIKKSESENEGVSIITCTNRPLSLKNILDNYLSQSYIKKELIIIINNDFINIEDWTDIVKIYDDITIYKLSEEYSLGKCINFGIKRAKYPYVSKFDDDDYYGPNYLVDTMNAFKYTDADVVGKNTLYAYMEASKSLVLRYPNQEHQYSQYVAGSTLTMRKRIFDYLSFSDLSRGEDTKFLMDCINMGIKIYATDRFNHIVIRRANIETHSWKISESNFMRNCIMIKKTNDFKSIVTI